jgi:hypothetical protein
LHEYPGQLISSISIYVAGNLGTQYLSFVSATTLADVVAAINTLREATGVSAVVSPANPGRVELRSVNIGTDQYVSVTQLAGQVPLLRAQAFGGAGVFALADYGCGATAGHCSEPATLYLSTGWHLQGDGSITLEIASNINSQQFTFASGTPIGNIIAAIESFAQYPQTLGVQAARSAENEERIELRPFVLGTEGFLSVKQISGRLPIIFSVANGGRGVFEAVALGQDALGGDVNCDRRVDGFDVIGVLDSWGSCPALSQPCPADVAMNGAVNIDDLLLVINNWGATD